RGHFGQYLPGGRAGSHSRIRTTLAGSFQNRAAGLPFARMASRTGIWKRGYSPRAGRGISRALFLGLRRNPPASAVRPNFWEEATALSSVTFSAYIPLCRGNPAMAITIVREQRCTHV